MLPCSVDAQFLRFDLPALEAPARKVFSMAA